MAQRIILIGGGIAGLTAGIYARKAGLEVDVYEKNAVPGGECTGWWRKGCYIDNCIHWLTGTQPDTDLGALWREVGALPADQDYVPTDRFLTLRTGSHATALWHDLDRTEAELAARAPEDRAEIATFMKHVRLAQSLDIPCKAPFELMTFADRIKLALGMRDMGRVMATYGKISLDQLADRFTSDLMKTLVTSYLPGSFSAYTLIVAYAMSASGNGRIPRGGSRALALRMADTLERLGGRLHLSCPIRRIATSEGRAIGVETADGRLERADALISSVDRHLLTTSLLDDAPVPDDWSRADRAPEHNPSISGVHVAFRAPGGVLEPGIQLFRCEELTAATHTTALLGAKAFDYEPDWAPHGSTVIQVSVAQSDRDFQWWKDLDAASYRAEKNRFAEGVKERLAAEFPALSGRLEPLDCWTPLTYERFCGAYHGSYMGFGATPRATKIKERGGLPGIRGLYLAGQWVMDTGGLPSAARSGKFAVQRILKDLGC